MKLPYLSAATGLVIAAIVQTLDVASALEAPPFSIGGPGVDPDDFRFTVFASGLDYPLGMAELDDGSLLVAISEGTNFSNSSGKLLRLVDSDGDGVADGPGDVLFDGLPGSQTAVRAIDDLVFVTSRRGPIIILRAGESPSAPLQPAGRILINYLFDWYHGHSALNVRRTPGVPKSYDLVFQLGSTSNASATSATVSLGNEDVPGAEGTLAGDAAHMITVVDHGDSVSAHSLRQLATGLRNAAGFTFHPTTGDLYLQDNGIDGFADRSEAHSADELNVIRRTEIGTTLPHFGYPHSYTTYRTGEVVEGGEDVVQPLIAFQPIPDPHTGRESEGPNDVVWAPPGFPAPLNRGVFIGFHGQYNAGSLGNEENPLVWADPGTGEYFHFIEAQQEGLGHLDGLLATRDSLFVADLASNGSTISGGGTGVIYQIRSLVPPSPPLIAIRPSEEGGLVIEWDRGMLEAAISLEGEWDLLDGFSPLPIEPVAPARFFRASY